MQVQAGGAFDIDYVVTDPDDTIILEGERERQGDYIFTGHKVGEYSFCFSNEMSSLSDKLVDFDIMVESEPRQTVPAKPQSIAEHTSSLEESIYKLSGSLSSIQRTQKYFRTRDARNRSTVAATKWRIMVVSLGESVLMIAMSALQVRSMQTYILAAADSKIPVQVYIVQQFFTNSVSEILHRVYKEQVADTIWYRASESSECETNHAAREGPSAVPKGQCKERRVYIHEELQEQRAVARSSSYHTTITFIPICIFLLSFSSIMTCALRDGKPSTHV